MNTNISRYQSRRVTSFWNVWLYGDGFKDGVVEMMPDGSKPKLCNGNISLAVPLVSTNWESVIDVYGADG